MYDTIIIGAKMSGVLAALKLAEKHQGNILLLESESEVLPNMSSSHDECYKLHTGVDFLGDEKTAVQSLLKSIEFARLFSEFLAEENLRAPWHRGRHYIMSNSPIRLAKVKAIACKLRAVYAAMVEEDEGNNVFGEVQDFIQFLRPDEYSHIATKIPFYDENQTRSDVSVCFGIETAETQIDFDRIKKLLQQKIAENPAITFKPLHEVIDLARTSDAFGYRVKTKNVLGELQTFETKTVVNSVSQNIQNLDQSLTLYKPNEERVIRVKMSILVELPESLRRMNTSIFSSDPYISITVLPNGTAILTNERTTNIGFYIEGMAMPEALQQKLATLTLERSEGQEFAQKILHECASYFSEETQKLFLTSKVKELRINFVKVLRVQDKYTEPSVYQQHSRIHAHLADDVEPFESSYIPIANMEMCYTASNARVVSEILLKYLESSHIKMEALAKLTKNSLFQQYPQTKESWEEVNSLLYISLREEIEQKIISSDFDKNNSECVLKLQKLLFTKLNASNPIRKNCCFFCVVDNNSILPQDRQRVDGVQSAPPILSQQYF